MREFRLKGAKAVGVDYLLRAWKSGNKALDYRLLYACIAWLFVDVMFDGLTQNVKIVYWKGLRIQRNCLMEDAELVRLCQNGDMAAFEQLFHKYRERMYGIAYRMMGNQEDAMDLTQEIFLKAYQKIGKYNFKSAFSTWLYRLAVNLCIDELRKLKSVHTLSVAETFPEGAVMQMDGNTPEDHAILKDREKQVWEAINLLKEKERAIIILRDMEGLSYKEIAKVFKCSLGRVKSRLHEARQKLKAILEDKTELLNEL